MISIDNREDSQPALLGATNTGGQAHSLWFRLAMWSVLFVIAIAAIEVAAIVTMPMLLKRLHFMFWTPNLGAVREAAKADATTVDEQIGWPSPIAVVSPPRDTSGAKYNPDFPNPDEACMSAYGDSFVWGDEVPPSDGWIEQLSRHLGCRVSNYGVTYYGTDQAYIRFLRNTGDKARTILLGIFPDDIVRNLNQYRTFIGTGPGWFWLKGRFVLDQAGHLEWIARPNLNPQEFIRLHQHPEQILPHEYFLPDSRDGPVTVRFPYTLTLARFALTPWVKNRLMRRTTWSDLYGVDHPSGATRLTVAIVEFFIREAERRGKRVVVIMLPSADSFRMHARNNEADYAPFVAAMQAAGIDVFDPIPKLLAALSLDKRAYCDLYVASCKGHFGVAGGAIVAKVVAAELDRRGLSGANRLGQR
jgi:hypothetical protein